MCELRNLVKLGQPLWYATYEDSGDSVISMAFLRLICQKNLASHFPLEISHAAALVASRTSLNMNPFAKLATELVGSHMAHLSYFDVVRKTSMASYPSDPILALASRRLWEVAAPDNASSLLSRSLTIVSHLMQSAEVAPGARGELVAQILCLRAADQYYSDSGISNPMGAPGRPEVMRVEGWVRFLLDLDPLSLGTEDQPPLAKRFRKGKGDASAGMVGRYAEFVDRFGTEENRGILNGAMYLTHFIKVDGYCPNRTDLLAFLHRGAGVVCKNNQAGIDLIIPVLMSSSVERNRSFAEKEPRIRGTRYDVGHGSKLDWKNPPIICGNDQVALKRHINDAASVLEKHRLSGIFGSIGSRPAPALHAVETTHEDPDSGTDEVDWNTLDRSMFNIFLGNEDCNGDRVYGMRNDSVTPGVEGGVHEEGGVHKEGVVHEAKADRWDMKAEYISYVVIQVKDYQSLKGLYNDPSKATPMPHIERAIHRSRPYMVMGMYFTGTSDTASVTTLKRGNARGDVKKRANSFEFALNNGHRLQRDLTGPLDLLLREIDAPIKLSKPGEAQLRKALTAPLRYCTRHRKKDLEVGGTDL